MTTGLGDGVKRALAGVDESDGVKVPDPAEEKWVPFDWTSDRFLIMCIDFRKSKGLVDEYNVSSPYWTESERMYWANLYKERGYDKNPKLMEDFDKAWTPTGYVVRTIVPDPPEEFVREWAKTNGVELRDADAGES